MRRFAYGILAVVVMFAATGIARADIVGSFVSAEGGSGGNTVNAADNDDGNFYSYTNSDTDGYWVRRTNWSNEPGGHCLEGGYPEMASLPQMKTTISGLTAGHSYAVSVIWAADTADAGWGDIGASLSSPSSLVRHYVGDGNSVSTGLLLDSPSNYSMQSPVGTAVADGSGAIAVYIGKTGSPVDCRTRYEGVAYEQVPAPEPSAMMLLCLGLSGLLAYGWRKRR
jgi:hypothetical protein